MNTQNLKSQIRKEFKDKRSNLTLKEVKRESKLICNNFIDNLLPKILEKFTNPVFAIYIDANNEVQTDAIIEHFKKNNITFCFPKISEDNTNLNYVKYDESLNFTHNKIYKNLQEPTSQNYITPNILITPLVAFDKNKSRIGMGKGFFDRSISKLKAKNDLICTIGLAFETQYYEQKLTPEKHDQTLDYIVSSHYIIS